jgi:outer membrane lipoprotein-sorting protein
VACSCILVTGSPANGDSEKAPRLKGFSPTAESAFRDTAQSIRRLKRYSDEAVVKVETGIGFGGMPEQKVAFASADGRRFRIQTAQQLAVSDGKKLYVVRENIRRYTEEPLNEDLEKQTKPYLTAGGPATGIGRMFLTKNPLNHISEYFEDMDMAGSETIDGDPCIRYDGNLKTKELQAFMPNATEVPGSVFLRTRDNLIRRIELDLSAAMEEGEQSWMARFTEYRLVIDIKGIKLNEEVDAELFRFEPSESMKKVDRFYSTWVPQALESAEQFRMSGKPAPEFELETMDGQWLRNDSLRDRVTVMLFVGMENQVTAGMLDTTNELAESFAQNDVTVAVVYPSGNADKIRETMAGENPEFTVLLDADRALHGEYFDTRWEGGVILVGRDGFVQGKHPWLIQSSADALKSDVEKLLAGETIPGGKEMTPEQIIEMETQKASTYAVDAAEPLNQDRLREAWSVHGAGGGWVQGLRAGRPVGNGYWIRTREAALLIGPDGKEHARISLPAPPAQSPYGSSMTVGIVDSSIGAVTMETIDGDQEVSEGWRPPKAAVITAYTADGNEAWSIEIDTKNGQIPQHLTMGDIDGRRGDELIFFFQGSIWILDNRGETIVRKPCPSWATWIAAEDLDRNGRAEIYIRTQVKLHRYDYTPN